LCRWKFLSNFHVTKRKRIPREKSSARICSKTKTFKVPKPLSIYKNAQMLKKRVKGQHLVHLRIWDESKADFIAKSDIRTQLLLVWIGGVIKRLESCKKICDSPVENLRCRSETKCFWGNVVAFFRKKSAHFVNYNHFHDNKSLSFQQKIQICKNSNFHPIFCLGHAQGDAVGSPP